jgi:lipid II:glycine glycyltransferase (peptidoglycan interpeptide bridge formation enzyme)
VDEMFIAERKCGPIKIVNIYFSEAPVNVNIPEYNVLTYYTYKKWDEVKGVHKIQNLTTTINLNQGIDDIWDKIKRQHKRHIRRAEKNGTKVKVSNNFEEFHKIYKKILNSKELHNSIRNKYTSFTNYGEVWDPIYC